MVIETTQHHFATAETGHSDIYYFPKWTNLSFYVVKYLSYENYLPAVAMVLREKMGFSSVLYEMTDLKRTKTNINFKITFKLLNIYLS